MHELYALVKLIKGYQTVILDEVYDSWFSMSQQMDLRYNPWVLRGDKLHCWC